VEGEDDESPLPPPLALAVDATVLNWNVVDSIEDENEAGSVARPRGTEEEDEGNDDESAMCEDDSGDDDGVVTLLLVEDEAELLGEVREMSRWWGGERAGDERLPTPPLPVLVRLLLTLLSLPCLPIVVLSNTSAAVEVGSAPLVFLSPSYTNSSELL
jgi:hypothetical protein